MPDTRLENWASQLQSVLKSLETERYYSFSVGAACNKLHNVIGDMKTVSGLTGPKFEKLYERWAEFVVKNNDMSKDEATLEAFYATINEWLTGVISWP